VVGSCLRAAALVSRVVGAARTVAREAEAALAAVGVAGQTAVTEMVAGLAAVEAGAFLDDTPRVAVAAHPVTDVALAAAAAFEEHMGRLRASAEATKGALDEDAFAVGRADRNAISTGVLVRKMARDRLKAVAVARNAANAEASTLDGTCREAVTAAEAYVSAIRTAVTAAEAAEVSTDPESASDRGSDRAPRINMPS